MYNTSLTTAGLNPQSPEKNIYHLQMWRRGNALRCICLPVHNALTFESYDLESSFFGMQVHLQNLQVKFMYQGQGCRNKKT